MQHLAATANTTTSVVAAYINGVAVPLTVVYGPSAFSGTFPAVPYLYVGRREDLGVGEGVAGAAYFPGILDEVSLYFQDNDGASCHWPSWSVTNEAPFPCGRRRGSIVLVRSDSVIVTRVGIEVRRIRRTPSTRSGNLDSGRKRVPTTEPGHGQARRRHLGFRVGRRT